MKKPPKVDLILVSHGHFDHIEDLVACARESGAPVVGIFELCDWLTRKGIAKTAPMNKGGSQEIAGLRVTMTDARHSSGYFDNGQMVYMGEPAGFVVRLEDGLSIYYAGDTCLFGDMRLIGELLRPGDRVSADRRSFHDGSRAGGEGVRVARREAGRADALGTFPLLTGTPAALKTLVEPRGVQVLELKPGETTE